ncbi:site-specific integrase [Rubrimonas cliftonensis]|uniref:Phage integrase family protein n=1 Tax=Rubrimonas cliftonensis TaxID=89524 RepID=A0A1H4FGS2_9RHOB|nr:site-specific integrase [Rubrimonas cliftonensis]SEA96237.1 Phage integrase family protein [Rubrimonas cliftonensis]
MGSGSNLQRRGEGLLFRRRVPRGAQGSFRVRVLTLPLGTHLLREGRRMAAHATRFTDAAFTLVVACGGGMLNAEDIERVVVDLMRFELEAREAARAVAPARASADIEAALRIEAASRQTLVAAIAHNDYAAVADPVRAALARLGVALAEDAPDWRMVARRAAIGLVAVCEENARRETGAYRDEAAQLLATAMTPPPRFAAPAHAAAPAATPQALPAAGPIPWAAASAPLAEPGAEKVAGRAAGQVAGRIADRGAPPAPAGEAAARVAAAKTRGSAPRRGETAADRTAGFTYRQPPPPNPAAPNGARKFFELGQDYVARRVEESRSWKDNSAGQVRSALKAFRAIEGDLTCDEVDETRLREFFETYRRLPRAWGKAGRTPLEEIDHADAREAALSDAIEAMRARGASQGDIDTRQAKQGVNRVRVATIYRVMQDLQRVVRDEGMENGCFARNVMQRVIWSKKKIIELQKDEADTPRLAWGDRAKDLFATKIFTKPLADPGDPLFWLPLLGFHAGLRMEEAAQLKPDDIDTIRGIAVIRIRQGAGQHLKNLSARRTIAIHDNLLSLGLTRLVEQRRQEGQEWLFPDLDRGDARGRKSEVFSSLFTDYRRDQGVYDPQRDFHSLRKDFNVGMKRRKVGLEIRKRLMGHRLVDVTETHYDPEGSPIEDYRAAVNSVALDISGVQRPFSTGSPEPARPRLRVVN